MNLMRRVKKLEKKRGVDSPIIIKRIEYVSPQGCELLTPEEVAALEAYEKKLQFEPLAKGQAIKVIYWTRRQAQELLAQAGKKQNPKKGFPTPC